MYVSLQELQQIRLFLALLRSCTIRIECLIPDVRCRNEIGIKGTTRHLFKGINLIAVKCYD